MIVTIKIDDSTLATLLSGLYFTYHDASLYSIPAYFWLMLTNAITPHLKDWRYDVESLESWVANDLLITAKEICTEDEIKKFQANTIYVESRIGNATLLATGDLIWESEQVV